MLRLTSLSLLVAGLAVCTPPALNAAEILVITHPPNGAWVLHPGEAVSVNGKDKLRRAGPSTGEQQSWDSKSIGHLQNLAIESWTVIRRAPDGRVLGRQAGSLEWEVLLPDGTKSQTPDSAKNLWSASTLALKHDKKDKSPAPIPVGELYAILIGSDAGTSAAAFVTDPALHQVSGVDEAQAFRNVIDLIPEVITSFPSGPPADRIREYLRSGMADKIRIWNQGDASVDVLNQGIAFAGASEAAYAKDPQQAELRKQIGEARKQLERRLAILRALDAGKQADAFLLAYRDFEPYDKSFPEVSLARRNHLKASSLAHIESAQNARAAGDYASAIHHLRIAQWRDPHSTEAANMLEQVRLEVARLSSQQFAEARRGIDPRSPKQVQLQRRLLLVQQYLNDGKILESENAIKEVEAIDKDEPKIKFLEAKLAVLRGDLGRALALLDLYAGLAVSNQDFDEGEQLRATVQYKIENARKQTHDQLAVLSGDQRFATALEAAANGLKVDNEDTDFLFQTGVTACVLRNCDRAAPLLHRFLDITDSTGGKREQRMAALRILQAATRAPQTEPTAPSSSVSWFSGSALAPGVFYDPVSLAFQGKVGHVKGSNHLTVAYEWTGEQLKSVHTKYEEKKTASNVLKIAVAGAAASQGIGSTVGWRTPDKETNDFYFNYYDDKPQVLKVGRDNVITKSRTIPITIPGIGGFGGIGAVAGLAGGLGGVSSLLGGLRGGASALGGLRGGASGLGAIGGFGGVSGFGGVGGTGALRALLASRSAGVPGGMGPANLESMFRQSGPMQTASVHADPQGGSTSGFLTLWNSPRIDTALAFTATGKRVAVGFSGNSFFHPFVWDAIHLFELDYDEQGRVQHAWELDNPSAPRLDFTWDGHRLMQLTGHATNGNATVYSRTLQYSGEKLVSETITGSGKSSHIKYKYDKQDRLVEADCDDDFSLDGRSRQVEFVLDTAKGGKR